MNKVIVVTGPTATGKTKLSIELAKKYNGEVINSDSTQVFCGLDIATAKVTEEEKENIVHHLIDIKNVTENYTVFDYQRDARNIINELLSKGKTPILVGGTGLYIKACLYDYKFNEEKNNSSFDDLSNEELYNKLRSIDPNIDIHPNNRKRLIRALNYCVNNDSLFSEKEKTDKLLYDTVFIGLTTDRDTLYNRINKRVDSMINNGLIEEAKKIYDSNIRTKAIMTPIGYKELFMCFDNNLTLKEATDLIKQRSRRYAKRQYTWFNHQMDIKWFNVDYADFSKTINEVENYIENKINL